MNLQKTLRWITLAALFLIPVFPLIVANSFFFPFITGKAFYFRILIEVASAGWVILTFVDARYRPRWTPLTIGVTVFAGVALVADLLGVQVLRSIWSNFERMEGWLVIAHLWAFYMVAAHVFGAGAEGKALWHRWFNVSLAMAFIVSLYAFAQSFGWAAIHQGSVRLDASLGNAAYLAVYLLMHLGLAAYMFFVARAREIRNARFLQWAYPILAVIFGFIILQSQTRGTILGLIGGIMLALALYAIFAKRESKRSRWISGGVIGVIILLGIIFWLNRDLAFIRNSPTLNRIATISLTDTKTQARAYVWPMALKGFVQRPIFGWGQENFNYIFNANYNPKMWNQEQWFDRAHSVYLDWLVASGAVGLLAYLALYVFFLMAVWRSSLSIAKKSVLTGLIAGYAVHNIFVFDNLASYVFFFSLLGFASSHRETPAISGARTYSKDAVEYIVAPIVLVALVAGIYFLNVRPIQANSRLIAALSACNSASADPALFARALEIDSSQANQEIYEQILMCSNNVIANQAFPGPTKQAFYDLSLKAIQDQIAAAPGDARMYVIGGSFLMRLNQIADATPLLEKAHELSPNKQEVNFQLAAAYMTAGKKDEALALLKQAYDADPSFEDAKSGYVIGLILAGRENEAQTLFGNDPKLFETGRVASIYASLKQYTKAIALFQKLVVKDPSNVQLLAELAQTQYQANMIWAATQTLQKITAIRPDLKPQVDAAIKQMQTGK